MKLTDKDRKVLSAIREWTPRQGAAFPNHHHISVMCGKSYSASDWAHAPLRKLLSLGLIEVVGKDAVKARTYRAKEDASS